MITDDDGLKTDDVYRDFYYALSKKYNLPHYVIKAICNSSFACISDTMRELTDLRDISIPYLGRFKLRASVKKQLTEKQNESTN